MTMETLFRTIRFGIRSLLKQPAYTLVAVLTLAVGIGANTAIFSVINAALLRPLPFKDANKIVYVWESNPKTGLDRGIASPPDFADWREQSHVFQQLSAWRTWFYTIGGGSEPEQVWGVRTSANFFQLLGVAPVRGRAFLPEEEQPGHDRVVMLSYGLWTRRFGANQNLIGQTVPIDDQPFTVIGILPPDFNLFGTGRPYDLWMPYTFARSDSRRDDYSLIVFGRLNPDVTLDQAQTEMSAIAQRLGSEYPATNQDRGARVVTLHENQASRLRPALLLLLAAVAFVWLMACANVANLLLARATRQRKELAIRLALGAGRVRLIRQLLTESMLLAIAGGVLGLLLAFWGLDLLIAFLPSTGVDEIPHSGWIGIDSSVFCFALLLSILTSVVFGLAPAFQLSKQDLNQTLKEGGRNSADSVPARRLRRLLVVTEVAMATVLLLGAGLMMRSFAKLLGADPGFNPENVLTMQVWLSDSRYNDPSRVADFYSQMLQRIKAASQVEAASAINFLPLSGWGDSVGFAMDQNATGIRKADLVAQYRVIDPDYFRTMGIPLLQGRAFDNRDRNEAQGVALINQAMARRFWTGENPVGRRIQPAFPQTKTPWRPASSNTWLTVVGVVGDIRESNLADEPAPEFYLPYLQNPSALMRLVVRGSAEPGSLIAAVRHEVSAVDRAQPLTEIKTLTQLISETMLRRRFNTALLAIFAAMALILASVGIYGVLSYSVTERTREIGIRMALGGQLTDVRKLVVGSGMMLALAGVGIGLAGAFAVTRLMTTLLYGVSPTDPFTFLVVSLILLGVAFLACYIPARRATKIDPLVALRHE
jgi:predicted permease